MIEKRFARITMGWKRIWLMRRLAAGGEARRCVAFLYKKVFRLQKLPYGGCLFLRKIT